MTDPTQQASGSIVRTKDVETVLHQNDSVESEHSGLSKNLTAKTSWASASGSSSARASSR
jgi:hypothetical protein